jgi:hypothetical protein
MSSMGWIIEPSTDRLSWLTIGPYTVELEHLRFGNDKTLQPRQIVRRDLPMIQKSWPRHRIIRLTFSNLKRGAHFPRNKKPYYFDISGVDFPAKRVLTYLNNFPGQSATLVVPEVTNPAKELQNMVYHGVIIEHTMSEISDDKIEITFTMDVTREFFPEGEMQIQ